LTKDSFIIEICNRQNSKKELNPFFHSVVREETIGCFSAVAKQILNFKNFQIEFSVDEIKHLTRYIKHEYEFLKELKIEIRKVLSFMMFLQ